jgi:DNA-binding NarL/FixJ family response regulator
MAIKVLLVDDHQVVREGLRRMLELDEEINVVGEAATGEEAISQAQHLSPDIILLDVRMPGMGGIESIRQLKVVKPTANIIVLTLYQDQYLAQAVEAGAAGYLVKDVTREELIQAVRAAYQGNVPLASSLTRSILAEYPALVKARQSSSLTSRQREILKLIAAGQTNCTIALKLFLSETTVKREVHTIFDRLGARDRAQAVSEAYKRSWI